MAASRDELIFSLAELEPTLRAEGVTHLTLFGSRARSDYRVDSDIDVVIDVHADSRFSMLELVGVAQAIEDKLSLPANVFMRRSLAPGFRETVVRDEIKIF